MSHVRRLPSGKYQAMVKLPNGRQCTRTDRLRSVVARWAADQEALIRQGNWTDPRAGKLTVGQWHERWSDKRVIEQATAARDDSHWRCHVGPAWDGTPLAAVNALDIETWLARMARDGVGATTRAQSYRLLRAMLADAAHHRMIGYDPALGVKTPRIPRHVDRFLSWPEFAALDAAMPTDRDRAMVRLMALCGLRWGEVAGLHAHRVNLDRGELTVQEVARRDRSVKSVPKSAAGQRYVPMVSAVVDAVAPFVGRGLLFPGVDYTNWRRRVFQPAVELAGLAVPYPTPHDLRHSYGSWLAEKGVPPHEIMKLMGHSSLRATERYLHAGDGRMDRARAALER